VNFSTTSIKDFLVDRKIMILRVFGVALIAFTAILGLVYQDAIARRLHFKADPGKTASSANQDVAIPSIINGELVLPKVSGKVGENNFGGGVGKARLSVQSANLLAIFDQQTQKLSSIRVIGEVLNIGQKIVTEVSPVIRFYDKTGKQLAQKVADLSPNYKFFDLSPGDKTYYDVLVSPPDSSERLEIVLNPVTATESAQFEQLKISGRQFETKTASQEQPKAAEPTPEASDSAASASAEKTEPVTEPKKVEYYSVSGSVLNPFRDLITDITVYAWVRNGEGKVFSFARQDFKNDLISPGDKVDFKLTLVPFKNDETMSQYELVAWGRRYKLGE
jgi:hypothetical protein